MTLDEAIKHAEEVAERNEEECKNWAYGASQINDDENRKTQYQKHAEMWHECAKEHRQLAEWLKELKAYKEQRCDAISRQAVLAGLASIAKAKAKSDAQKSLMGRAMFFVEQSPPVTSEQKIGRWIPLEYNGYADGNPVWDKWECSKCGWEHSGDKESLTAFCPNCGAKMEVKR